jgi:hypothetical protein
MNWFSVFWWNVMNGGKRGAVEGVKTVVMFIHIDCVFCFFSFSLSLDGPARCLSASSTDSLHYSWRTGGGRTWRMDNWIIPLPERAHLRLLLHKTIETRLLGEKKKKTHILILPVFFVSTNLSRVSCTI